MPASLLEPLVYRLLHLDSAAIVIIVRGLYNSLGGRIKTHQACRAPGDNVLLSKSPWKLDEVGHVDWQRACGRLIVWEERRVSSVLSRVIIGIRIILVVQLVVACSYHTSRPI
jgi:hypothetical protein